MTLRTSTLALVISMSTFGVFAQDWPQWRGPHRDAKAGDFKAPKVWPKELTQKWKVTVGDGVASPSLLGDKLYVFARQDGNEVLRCLSVSDGKELWSEKYESLGASGPAQSFSGPRSSPAVADGKVVTLGVRGMLSSLDAATGRKLWRKDDFRAWPNFFPSSSPMVVDGNVIAQLGGRENGAIVAYDLTTGAEKWKWSGPSPSYASPVLMSLGGMKLIIAQTESKLVAINSANGSLAWEQAPAADAGGERQGGQGGPGGGGRGRGGGRDYRAATPIVDGQTIIVAGRGVTAVQLEKTGDQVTGKTLWSNAEKTVSFNSPTLKDGMLYGLSGNNEIFCLSTKDGSTAWTAPFPSGEPAANARSASLRTAPAQTVFAQNAPAEGERPERPRGPGGPGGFGGRRGGGGGGGYGNIVNAGSVLMALTPGSRLVVFEPGGKEFKEVANYKVAEGQTHACPVVSGNRIIIKDKDSVTLWTVE